MKSENYLMNGEELIKKVQFSKMAFIGMAIKAIVYFVAAMILLLTDAKELLGESEVIAIVFKLLGGVALLAAVYNVVKIVVLLKTNVLVVTDRRLYGRVGVLKKETIDIPLVKLDNISVSRGSIGAMIFGYNTITVSSSVTNFAFSYAANANEFKNAIFDAQEAAKEKERKEKARSMAEALAIAQGKELKTEE